MRRSSAAAVTELAVVCLAVVVVSCPIAAGAQSPGKVLERYIAAIGGQKAVDRIASTEVSGSVVSADGRTGAFTQQTKRPNLIATSVSWGESRWRAGFNGRAAWEDVGDGPRTLSGAVASGLRADAAYTNARFDLPDNVSQLLAAGRGQVRDRAANLVIAVTADGAKRTLFFDADTYLLLKDERETDDGVEERFFDDYRAVDQVLEPHRIEWRRNGETFRIAVQHVTHNAPLDDRVFDVPATPAASPLDGDAVISAAAAIESKTKDARVAYAYDLVVTGGRMDSQGRVAREETAAYEVLQTGGLTVRKHLRDRGQPLSASDRKREDERVNGILESIRLGKPARVGTPSSSGGTVVHLPLGPSAFSALVRMSEFSRARREALRGRTMVVVEFQPKRGADAKNPVEQQAARMAGALWIDEATRQAARVESYFLDDHERTIKGSALRMERVLVNDDVWLPSRDEVNLRWSFAFGNLAQMLTTSTYSGHRRFGVETDTGFQLPDPPSR